MKSDTPTAHARSVKLAIENGEVVLLVDVAEHGAQRWSVGRLPAPLDVSALTQPELTLMLLHGLICQVGELKRQVESQGRVITAMYEKGSSHHGRA